MHTLLQRPPTDGGEHARIRVDVSLADAYYVEITPPTEFSSAPTLPDVITWTGGYRSGYCFRCNWNGII